MYNSSICNSTEFFPENRLALSSSICILSTFILTLTTFAGSMFNIKALRKILSMYHQRKTQVPLIQLLTVSTIFTCVLAPYQIVHIWLAWHNHDFLISCSFHQFFKLLADSCSFVTTVMITFERLKKIISKHPIDTYMSLKKMACLCSWVIIIPVSAYLVYNDTGESSMLWILCTSNTPKSRSPNPNVFPQTLTNSLFLLAFIVASVMYLIGILTIWKESKTITRNVEFSSSLAGQGQGSSISRDQLSGSPERFSHTPLNSPRMFGKISDVVRPSTLLNRSDISFNLERLEKIKEEGLCKQKRKSKESISDDDIDIVILNPLRHTRMSAGNAWCESDSSLSSKCSARNSQAGRKRKKKRKQYRKKRSIDSFGTMSMTSDYSLSSLTSEKSLEQNATKNLERGINMESPFDEFQDKISVILEQPEYDKETVSLRSRMSKLSENTGEYTIGNVNRVNQSGPDDMKPAKINENCPSFGIERPTIDLGTVNKENQIKQSRLHKCHYTRRDDLPRNTSWKFCRESSSTMPKTSSGGLSGFSEIKSCISLGSNENKRIDHVSDEQKISVTSPRLILVKSADVIDDETVFFRESKRRFQRKSKSEEFLGTLDCVFDEVGTTDKMTRAKSFDLSLLNIYRGQTFFDSNSYEPRPYRISSSMIDLSTVDQKLKKTYSSSETQTDAFGDVPVIRITRPSVQSKLSPRQNQFKKVLDNGSSNEIYNAQARKQSCLGSRSSSTTKNRNSTFYTVKRCLLIMGAFAMSRLPSFVVVMLYIRKWISVQGFIDWNQIANCVQYVYFAFVPIIYVYTNKGLLKNLKHARR